MFKIYLIAQVELAYHSFYSLDCSILHSLHDIKSCRESKGICTCHNLLAVCCISLQCCAGSYYSLAILKIYIDVFSCNGSNCIRFRISVANWAKNVVDM